MRHGCVVSASGFWIANVRGEFCSKLHHTFDTRAAPPVLDPRYYAARTGP